MNGELFKLPNIRKIFIPDDGYTTFEADLKGADTQVVAWEAEDEDLKAAFRAGIDIHEKNAEDMWGHEFTCLPAGSHARHKKRQECKHTVHGCDYGCTPRTTAIQRGWTVHEAQRFHNRWFSLHPKIKTNFHGRVQAALDKNKVIYNKFGYRRVYFDRPDEAFTEALAWIPQSTVALITFRGMSRKTGLRSKVSWIEILAHTHDGWVFQVPHQHENEIETIRGGLEVVIPYDDPLIIPWDLKRSRKSWGDCEKIVMEKVAA
jgi:DNA polymerase-1